MAAAVNASRSGDLLNDIYELCEIVESRDTHQLYSARDTRNDRLVHIALLRPEVALRNGVAQRFVKGPKALTLIEHPNVARIWSVESDATGIPFIVEEPKSGQTLAAMIEAFPDGMPLGVAVNLLVPVVEAMAAAHGSGLVHGAFDAKHVLLSEHSGNTVPKVFGFGESDKACSPCDDVLAIGALMYRALSGQAADTKRRIPLDEIAPHLPLELTELVERCLADKDERPADARMLSDELNGLRQKIVGQRASAVNTERFVPRVSPAPLQPRTGPVAKPPAKAASKPIDKPVAAAVEQERRRVVMERAETAPMEPPPVTEPVAAKIDPHGATCVDADPPVHEPQPEPIKAAPKAAAQPAPKPAPASEPARERDSVEFPMASVRPSQPQPAAAAKPKPVTPDQIATKADEPQAAPEAPEPDAKAQAPQQTREDRGGKGKARKQDSAKAKKDDPAINVAGPARLAAAFAPLEGAANIEQGETREAGLGREFRRQQDEEREKREARYGRPMPVSAAGASADPKQTGPQAKNGAALFNGKAAADGKKPQARPSAAEVIALGQLHAQEEEKKERRSRLIGALLLFLFCFLLARAVPVLTGPRERAIELLGPNLKITAVAFAAFSVVMLIKTWALQIQSKAMLLKPVTYTMKVVVISSVVLCASYLMPAGSLGIVEGAARRFLPWGGAAYFMFLGFYGMMKGMRETQANMIAGIAMTLAYGGSFVGSYMIANNVIAPNMRASRAQAQIAMQMVEAQKRGEKLDPKLLLNNAGVDPDMAAEIAKQAAAEDGFKEAKVMGGNEEEDMKSIREMGDARKRNGERLDELKDKLPELAK